MKARFRFRPDSGEAMLIKPWNVEAVDSFPEPVCDVDSGAFCAKLASSMAAMRHELAGDRSDASHHQLQGHARTFFTVGCNFGSSASPLAYVQRTRRNAPFFLFVRDDNGLQ